MCTRPHPAARRAAERLLATNPGDPATYDAVDLPAPLFDVLCGGGSSRERGPARPGSSHAHVRRAMLEEFLGTADRLTETSEV